MWYIFFAQLLLFFDLIQTKYLPFHDHFCFCYCFLKKIHLSTAFLLGGCLTNQTFLPPDLVRCTISKIIVQSLSASFVGRFSNQETSSFVVLVVLKHRKWQTRSIRVETIAITPTLQNEKMLLPKKKKVKEWEGDVVFRSQSDQPAAFKSFAAPRRRSWLLLTVWYNSKWNEAERGGESAIHWFEV